MQAAKVLLVPFLLAVFFALICVRPMLWLQAHRVPSVFAALLVVSALMLVLFALGSIVGTSIAGFTAALPDYQNALATKMQTAIDFIEGIVGDDISVDSLRNALDPGRAMGMAAGLLTALRGVLTNTFLILFTMVFILLEATSFQTKAKAAFGTATRTFDGPRQFLDDLGRYLGIKTVVSIVTGIVVGIMTAAFGLDFPLLWAMLAFLFNYIPNIGSIIAAVPAVLLALVQLTAPEALGIAIGYVAINTVIGNIVEPRLMGYGVGVSPLIVFVGLVFWGWVFGPVGMLLSVPLTMGLKLGLESNDNTRWIAILVGSEADAEYALAQRKRDEAAQEAEQAQNA
ncbi:MAG: AI-2E family transporter [Gammaproteobacteria bacterium]|nr:AI-2E family transporter [Gammaproteobacteria bacterium]